MQTTKSLPDKIKIGVVDSGIDFYHPWLKNFKPQGISIARNTGSKKLSLVENDFSDVNGHGTACAGIIASKCPEAELVSIRILNNNLRAHGDELAVAIEWAAANNIDILNLSLGTFKKEFKEIIANSCYFASKKKVLIFGASACSKQPSYPQSLTSVVTVDSAFILSNQYLIPNNTSSDFLAKGDPQFVAGLNNSFCFLGGSSMAVCHITGLAARIISEDISARKNIRRALIANTINLYGKDLYLALNYRKIDFGLSFFQKNTLRKKHNHVLKSIKETVENITKREISFNTNLFTILEPQQFIMVIGQLEKNLLTKVNLQNVDFTWFYSSYNLAKNILYPGQQI